MVEHPASVEFEENSSDIELTLEVSEESFSVASNGVISTSKKKDPEIESLSTMDKNTLDKNTLDQNIMDTSDCDLSINSRIIQAVMDEEEVDSVEVESTTCDPVDQSCNEITSLEKLENGKDKTDDCGLENHVSDSSAKVNGFSSTKSSDDISQNGVGCKQLCKTESSLKKLLCNGSLNDTCQSISEKIDRPTESPKSVSEETKKSSTDLPISNGCDKLIDNSSNESRVNGNSAEFHDDGYVSPDSLKRKLDSDSGDSDSGSGNSPTYPEKRSKSDDSENGLSSSEERLNSDDSEDTSSRLETLLKTVDFVVPNGRSDSESSTNSATNCFQKKKKTTARKSTGGTFQKTTKRRMEDECSEEFSAEAEDLAVPTDNAVDYPLTDFVNADASSEEELQSLSDDNRYPIKFTRESVSERSKNILEKMVKLLSRRQLEDLVLQTCCDVVCENSFLGELKRQALEAEELEFLRKNKINSLEKQIHQLRALSEVFCTQARLAQERGQIIPPRIITRSVGLQVNERKLATTECNSPATRANSVDEGDPRTPFSVINGRIQTRSTNTGQTSSCSSSTNSPRPSFSEPVNSRCRKRSLPTDNNSVVNGESNSNSPPKNNTSSEVPAKVPRPIDDTIVDLTDVDDSTADSPPKPSSTTPRKRIVTSRPRLPSELSLCARHPAPLPPTPNSRFIPGAKLPPPRPNLTIQKYNSAIQMTWDLPVTAEHETIVKYQIYAYQETAGVPATVNSWNSIGDVESLDLPMACTLTQFMSKQTYHFVVRAIDKHGRYGAFSYAKSVAL